MAGIFMMSGKEVQWHVYNLKPPSAFSLLRACTVLLFLVRDKDCVISFRVFVSGTIYRERAG